MKKNNLLLVVSLNAELDTLETAEWYEKQADFIGNKFLGELQTTFDKILSFPEASGWHNKYMRIRKHHLLTSLIMFFTWLKNQKSGS